MWFFTDNFWTKHDRDTIRTASCSSRQDASTNIHVDLERSGWKFDLRSRSRRDLSCTWIEAYWRDKYIETTFMSLALLNLKLSAKNCWWPRVTSDDLSGVTDQHLTLCHHEWPKSIYMVLKELHLTVALGRILLFPPFTYNGEVKSLAWPQVIYMSKIRDLQVVGTSDLINPRPAGVGIQPNAPRWGAYSAPCLTPELIGAARQARRRSKALTEKIPCALKIFFKGSPVRSRSGVWTLHRYISDNLP